MKIKPAGHHTLQEQWHYGDRVLQSAVQAYYDRTGYSVEGIRAALIDMDGTLYDSMPSHARAWMQMAEDNGLNATYEEFFEYEGRTGASTINILFQRQYGRDATDEEARRLYAQKTENFRSQPPVGKMPAAPEVLNILRERNITRVLVTGSGQRSLIDRLMADYPGMFEEQLMVTSADVRYGKPHPEPYLLAAQKAGVSPNQAIAIENAPLGVESAHKAGVFTIGVVTGPLKKTSLKDAGADFVFNSMPECAKNLCRLLYYLGHQE